MELEPNRRGGAFGHPVAVPRNRVLLLGGAVAAAAAVVAIVIVVAGSGSGSSSPTTTTTGSTPTTSGPEAVSTFAGVPQRGDTLGKAGAPVTLTVFEDPQCPFCRQWNIDTLPTVVENYVRTGRIKVVYRGVIVIGENSLVGLAAEYAAGQQNKLWQMAEALYERQGDENSGWLTTAVVRDAAREIGLSPAKVVAAMKSAAVASAIQKSVNEARSLGIRGTPTFAIQKQLGQLQQLGVSGLEPGDFTSALDQALR
jgi:protein-disulfide isomerase